MSKDPLAGPLYGAEAHRLTHGILKPGGKCPLPECAYTAPPATELTAAQQIRTAALDAASILPWQTPETMEELDDLTVLVLTKARRFERYIATGETDA